LAICFIKTQDYRQSLDFAEKALKVDSRNVKGLWRRGIARQELSLWEEAKRDYTTALEIEPDNKSVKQSLTKLKAIMAKYDEQERAKYKNMFK